MEEKARLSKEQILDIFGKGGALDARPSDEILRSAKRDLTTLFYRADGNKDAFEGLVGVATHAAWLVQQLVHMMPEQAKEAAMRSPVWPVNITDAPAFPEDLDKLRSALNIGQAAPGPFKIKRRFNKKTFFRCREILVLGLSAIQHAQKHGETQRLLKAIYDAYKIPGLEEKMKDAPPNVTVIVNPLDGSGVNTVVIKKRAKSQRSLFAAFLSRLCSLLKLQMPAGPQAAVRVLKIAEQPRPMPSLSSNTKELWLNALFELLRELTGGTLSEGGVLWEIGKYRVGHYTPKDPDKKKSIQDNVWDGLTTRLTSMLDGLLDGELKGGIFEAA